MHDPQKITIHARADYEAMHKAGRLAAQTLDMIAAHVAPGVTTDALDALCHDFIVDHGAVPAPLNYHGFPKSVCTSVNHVVCHGIPGDKVLRDGDILNIDVTTIVDGWFGDTSRMFTVGEVSVKAKRLIDITFETMWAGIRTVKPGATVGDIGHAMQTYAERHRCSVVEEFCGHGIGQMFQTVPSIMNFGIPGTGAVLQEGMFFTVEPMVNLGKAGVKILGDGWTAVTKDRSLSAQFEHSIGVTADGFEVFTLSPQGLDKPPYT
ncbi:type I methionyl aminopeptidase [Magnetovibrio sp.]|uniref:type I methionyl aminopeptidase n=1 Tax=Magnetovibrio sp. TaxID=2024836 RepID=UPI002F94A1DF